MKQTETLTREDVLDHLKGFFPLAFVPRKLEADTGSDLPADAIVLENEFELRTNLFLFRAEDLLLILPPVLADLLPPEGRSGIEAVVTLLNITPESDECLQTNIGYFGAEIAEKLHKDAEELYISKLESFEPFDQGQASALYSWLQLASQWPELSDDFEDVKSALQYWRNRAGC